MVFQNYALYPHMTVRENMGFALKLAKVPEAEINQKVEEAARILDLTQHLDRKPANLSGGQRQRVAMGRAIVRNPKAFLMDEPLSNLDAKLRVQTRAEVARLQDAGDHDGLRHPRPDRGHDARRPRRGDARRRAPAGRHADRALRPAEEHLRAGFIGSPSMNFLPATIEGDRLKLPIGDIALSDEVRREAEQVSGRGLLVGIRPEDFEDAALVGDKRERGLVFRTTIDVLEAMGSEFYAHFAVEGERVGSQELQELAEDAGTVDMAGGGDLVVARLNPESKVTQGQGVELWLDTSKIHVFDPDSGRNLAL